MYMPHKYILFHYSSVCIHMLLVRNALKKLVSDITKIPITSCVVRTGRAVVWRACVGACGILAWFGSSFRYLMPVQSAHLAGQGLTASQNAGGLAASDRTGAARCGWAQ